MTTIASRTSLPRKFTTLNPFEHGNHFLGTPCNNQECQQYLSELILVTGLTLEVKSQKQTLQDSGGFSDHFPAGLCSKCQASDWSILVTWPQYWPLIGLNPGSQKRENYHHLCSLSPKYHPRYLDPDSSQTIYISDKLYNLRDFNFNKNQEQISLIISQMFG